MHGRRLATTEEVIALATPDSDETIERLRSWTASRERSPLPWSRVDDRALRLHTVREEKNVPKVVPERSGGGSYCTLRNHGEKRLADYLQLFKL